MTATSWFDPGRPAADDLSGGLLAAGGGATPVWVRARAEGSFEKSRTAAAAAQSRLLGEDKGGWQLESV